jgi:hypothetical protein
MIRSSETLLLTRVTWLYIPEDTILHSHRSENLKSYSSSLIRQVEGEDEEDVVNPCPSFLNFEDLQHDIQLHRSSRLRPHSTLISIS